MNNTRSGTYIHTYIRIRVYIHTYIHTDSGLLAEWSDHVGSFLDAFGVTGEDASVCMNTTHTNIYMHTTLPDSDFLAERSDHVANFLDAFGVTGEDATRSHLVLCVCISLISYNSHHNSRAEPRHSCICSRCMTERSDHVASFLDTFGVTGEECASAFYV